MLLANDTYTCISFCKTSFFDKKKKTIVLFSLQSIIRKESKYVCHFAQKGEAIHISTAIPTNFPLKSKGMVKKKTD